MLEPMSEQDIVTASTGVADVTADHRGRLSYEFDGHGLLKFARAIEAARDAAWQAHADALVAQAVAREREACAKLRQTAEQVLADMRAHGVLIEWQTALDDAIRARSLPGAVVLAYAIGDGRDAIKIEQVQQMAGPAKWAVRQGGNCLGRDGWEWEPMPSGRNDEFLARCRYDTPDEAMDAIRARIQGGGNHG